MKKVCLLLLAFILLIYGYQGFKVVYIYTNDELKIKTAGKLSEITENVVAVALDKPDSGVVRNIKHVRKDGDNLFMLSNNRLLHFNMQGKFINQIASEMNEANEKIIVEYVLNTDNHQALVIDSERNISAYDYSGQLVSQTQISHPWKRITAIACHSGYLWVTAETLTQDMDNPDAFLINHNLYQMDLNMNEIRSQTLRTANAGRKTMFNLLYVDELLADDAGVYAFSPIEDANQLLTDTLYFALQKRVPFLNRENEGMACIYPIRKGKRFYISTKNNRYPVDSFTFCYDEVQNKAYMLADGFKDDFLNV